ncbi:MULTISPECIES: TVP38/TMEM64 family protein [Paenibacillus]|uniref:TVP38/TMEM64 family protein n=1 Tax=Paenibacillus TaxID=44249 RepID=UPI0022B89AF2|nr:TVP38/TMEM64 family protein [Paenibacillus caseinilyticus]MCZ8520238.1 TVP38/TMEM64 family protein [Paenibacillus caseinilyticus]
MGEWDIQHLSDTLNSLGLLGQACGALLILLQTLVPFVPFVVVAGANVLLFGFWLGFLVNYVFACLGAVIAFLGTRRFGRQWAQSRLSKYKAAGRFNEKLEKHGLLYIAISRVTPVLPSFGINMAAAVMNVRARDFILGTLIGKLPMILLESMIGHDLLHFTQYKGRLLILLGVFALLLAIGNHLKKKWAKDGGE